MRVLRVAVAIAAVIALLACGIPWLVHQMGTERAAAETPEPTAGPAPAQPQAPAPAPEAVSTAVDLSAAFAGLQNTVGADIGLAYAPLSGAGQIHSLGAWSSGPAWSTIKVPLALAFLRQDGAGAVDGTMRAAITASDNGAAEQMWEQLGAHQTAADKVEAVLSEAGGPPPAVPSEVTRPGFSAFGQTRWSLADQVRFLAHAACDARNGPVLDLMGDVVSGQRWGLGTIGGAKFKGGWGPGTDGRYLVRQYGIIDTPTGQVVVAVAAVPDSGGFGDGTAILTRMTSWLKDHIGDIGGDTCDQR
ncbi:hypothetical protein [Mycobacterium sp. BK086]|uniref:hypothetical protein n=1 Tax=Mycobacterium sp. BK086 TaxID=2512165 RepID=UPI00105E179A|nr:hypothetical protein [Mycobacterium sp. BK086]